jgi:hypothetical protein
VAALLLLACAPADTAAAPPAASAPPTLDPATRDRVIDTALAKIGQHYLVPAVATKIDAAVRAHQRRGDYDRAASGDELAKLLSAHLFDIAHDGHLSVRWSAAVLPPETTPYGPLDRAKAAEEDRFSNHGFERVERLDGNIGYLRFDEFADPSAAGETVMDAFGFVADSDALIIDLRDNHGGRVEMVAFVETYLFDGEPVHVNDVYDRSGTVVGQSWTAAFVPGKRFVKDKRGDKPVYVLTSSKTVSGGEAFAYELQALKRATVVGETTVGAANPGRIHRIDDHFRMQIAEWRVVNEVTHGNWEGVGVRPDVPVAADRALATAKVLALQARAGKASDPDEKEEIRDALASARAELTGASARAAP